MSTDSIEENDIGQLEISNADNIRNFEYLDFNNIEKIGKGRFGKVFRAKWKTADGFFALKTFNDDETTLEEVKKEVHENFDLNKKYTSVFD
jgi:hypothetical protein